MAKRYYVRYTDFSDVYDLAYVDCTWTPEKIYDAEWFLSREGYDRIARREAERLCREERRRRRENPGSSGFASAFIRPAGDYNVDYDSCPYVRCGYLVIRR